MTTTDHSPSTSPTSSGFIPSSPTKRDSALRPNPHPYAIRTTSTGVLSRSNSSGHSMYTPRHRYVPSTPTSSNSSEFVKAHRPSNSLDSAVDLPSGRAPRPLPIPPSLHGDHIDETQGANNRPRLAPRRAKRAETLPNFLEPQPMPTPQPPSLDDLPPNPKLWTPAQLSSYLVTALRIRSSSDDGVVLPDRVAKDIATFVKHARITGRTFLRLSEEDLNSMDVNKKWGEALLISSRDLRQNVLKGRIWGTDSDELPSPGSTSPTPSSQPFYSAHNSSSGSVDLLPVSDEGEKRPKRYRNGRVRGMVENLERSFSSDSSCDESDDHRLARLVRQAGPVDEESPCMPTVDDPHAVIRSTPALADAVEEEPTVEDLLASETGGRNGTWGARAWEEMDLAPGITVKHLSNGSDNHKKPSIDRNAVEDGLLTVTKNGSMRGSWKNSIRRGRDERRVVTAIFTPTVIEPPSGPTFDDQHLSGDQQQNMDEVFPPVPPAPAVEPKPDIQVPEAVEQVPSSLEETLLAELSGNRVLLEALRLRLELVEKKLADLEEREVQREREVQLDPVARAEFAAQATFDGEETPQETDPRNQNSESFTAISPLVSQASSALHSIADHLIPASGVTVRDEDDDGKARDDESPSSMSELPSYVFLVGLGVCAVVLQVMLRRVSGRSLGWRP